MKVTIHQPEHLPWLGFFDKVAQADICVALDTAQYRKNYFHNRNKIRTGDKWQWITMPVRKAPAETPLREILLDDNPQLRARYLDLVTTNYRRSPFFQEYFQPLREVVTEVVTHGYPRLVDLNIKLLEFLLDALNIKTPIVLASSLNLPAVGGGTEVNLCICRALGAHNYLSGISGRDYLDETPFRLAGIGVAYQEFYHPVYPQLYEGFVPCMSAIDLLFNHGCKSAGILKGVGVERLDKLFI